jgi:hypothetical protein
MDRADLNIVSETHKRKFGPPKDSLLNNQSVSSTTAWSSSAQLVSTTSRPTPAGTNEMMSLPVEKLPYCDFGGTAIVVFPEIA